MSDTNDDINGNTNNNTNKAEFFCEITEHQISASEFFGITLINLINKNFGLENIVISYFDTSGKFLSWLDKIEHTLDSEQHPYRDFMLSDVVRFTIFKDAVFDKLTYFNTNPRIYKSTELISKKDYEQSSYVRFLEEVFNSHYSATLAFGINAYIQVTFLKTYKDGDFNELEIKELHEIYTYIANAYKTFKKHEQSKIVSNIKTEIIESGEKAYIIMDDFNNIMSINTLGKACLKDVLGLEDDIGVVKGDHCEGLNFLLGTAKINNGIKTRIFKNYVMKIHTYNQSYSNGIVDKYHWVTITVKKGSSEQLKYGSNYLTKTERKVAELMYDGMTYQQIADELVVSYHTIKKHVQNIYIKCDVKSRNQLYKWLEKKE